MFCLASMESSLMFLAGCALLTFLLMKRSYRYFGRRRRRADSAPIVRIDRPATKWDGVQRDALAQVERQKVEMYEISRDLNGQLSSRIIVLEKLIEQSQRQIERMEQLLDEAKQLDTTYRR